MYLILIITLALALAVSLAVLAAVWRARKDMISDQAVCDVLNGVDSPDHGEPCRHPGCLWGRVTLLNLTEATKRNHRSHRTQGA